MQLSESSRRSPLVVPILLMWLGGCGQSASAPTGNVAAKRTEVTVAAAADLKFALDEVVAEFEHQNPGIHVKTTYGSSGNFFAQLSNQAPFDIYFSADIDYPRKLIEQGQGLKESEFLYAVGRIVVWVRNDSSLDLDRLGMEALLDPTVRKIAIANPEHAPYGRAAKAAMKHFDIYDKVNERLVLGENIAQTAQFVQSGGADIGIIALSLAAAPMLRDEGRFWIVPLDSYPQLEQGGVILRWAKDHRATEMLRAFVVGESGRAILRKYGFVLPGD